ncbi:hypothetical protein DW168_20390 [Parabacteroides distasonis]|nr:hypothetical protein DW168_20390 [Parabacteroides distasonis]
MRIIAFLSLLFLLPGCKEEKTQSVFDADEFDCVGWPHIRKVTITNVNCEAEGIFLILEDSLVYCDDEIVIPYKNHYGKRLEVGFCFGDRKRYPLCKSDSSVIDISVLSVRELNE